MRETHHPSSTRLRLGDQWTECPRCSFDTYRNDLVPEPISGLWVCPDCKDDDTVHMEKVKNVPSHRPLTQTNDLSKHRIDVQSDTTITTTYTNGTYNYVNTAALVLITLTLPAATVGQSVRITRLRNFDVRIDPDGSEVITGGGAGKYLQLSSDGAYVDLVCSVDGTWTPTISGTSSFEA